MTENKRFRLGYVCGDYGLIDNDEWIDLHSMSENSEKNVQICINKMNELADENEQLKKEKEFWKSDACSLSSLNSILSNELSIAQEQGYEPSTSYKEYITSIKTEYDKFWENKIKTHNNRLKELQRND